VGWIDRIIWALLVIFSFGFIGQLLLGDVRIGNDVGSGEVPMIFAIFLIAMFLGGLFCMVRKHKYLGTIEVRGERDKDNYTYGDARSYTFDFWFMVALVVGIIGSVVAYDMPTTVVSDDFVKTTLLLLGILLFITFVSKKRSVAGLNWAKYNS